MRSYFVHRTAWRFIGPIAAVAMTLMCRDAPAAAPMSVPEGADVRALDTLFARLGKATDQTEADGIAGAIQRIWMHSPSDTANLLMARAVAVMHAGDLQTAESLLDKTVVVEPGWAEAWNQRATIRFLRNNPRGSMADIAQVLVREPRHFGALTGMAALLQTVGMKKAALTVYRQVLKIYPQESGLRQKVDDLSIDVEGRPI